MLKSGVNTYMAYSRHNVVFYSLACVVRNNAVVYTCVLAHSGTCGICSCHLKVEHQALVSMRSQDTQGKMENPMERCDRYQPRETASAGEKRPSLSIPTPYRTEDLRKIGTPTNSCLWMWHGLTDQTPELQTRPIVTSWQHFWPEQITFKTKLWGTHDVYSMLALALPKPDQIKS
jgi:hypothetical protein